MKENWRPTEEYLCSFRREVEIYTDCVDPTKPIWHDDRRLVRTMQGYTGYVNCTTVETWTDEQKLKRWRFLKTHARRRLEKAIEGPSVTTKRKSKAKARVTTKTYERVNPHPKKYATNAERQAAYRRRLRRNTANS